MIYLVNCDKSKFFKTFDSLESVINYLKDKNNADFDGGVFSLFGRGQKEVWKGDETELHTTDGNICSCLART